MSSNLPPGVSESMLPGCSSEDAAWEKLIDAFMDLPITAEEAETIIKLGITFFNITKEGKSQNQITLNKKGN